MQPYTQKDKSAFNVNNHALFVGYLNGLPDFVVLLISLPCSVLIVYAMRNTKKEKNRSIFNFAIEIFLWTLYIEL